MGLEHGSDFLHFEQLKIDFFDIIKEFEIEIGTVLKSKIEFSTWLHDPIVPSEFQKDLIFTVVDIQTVNDECVLSCLQNNRIVAIDVFVFFLNSKTFLTENFRLRDEFPAYFEKII